MPPNEDEEASETTETRFAKASPSPSPSRVSPPRVTTPVGTEAAGFFVSTYDTPLSSSAFLLSCGRVSFRNLSSSFPAHATCFASRNAASASAGAPAAPASRKSGNRRVPTSFRSVAPPEVASHPR